MGSLDVHYDGNSKLIGDAYEIFEECVYDIQAWVDFLKSKGYTKIHLQGHSLGCSKITYYKSLTDDKNIKSLLLISPADMIGLLVNEKDISEYDKRMTEAKKLSKEGRENDLLSGILWGFAMQSAKSFINFSKENKNIAVFNYYNPELGFETLKLVDIPILAFTGTNDDAFVTDKQKSLDRIKKEAVKCPKFVGKIFNGAEHEFIGFDKDIIDEVIKFIK